MGKWAALKATLKPLPVEIKFDEGASYQDKVDAVKAELITLDINALAAKYNELCDTEAEVKAFTSDLNVQFEALDQLLATQLENRGLSSFKLKSGENFILIDQPHTTVKDKGAVRQWFMDQGMTEILAPPWATLNALVKGILEVPIDPLTGKPKPMPEGIDVYMKTSIQRRKK